MSRSTSSDEDGSGDAAGTRERILEVAARCFSEKGFAGTTVRHICQAASITAPTLYYHFGSKDGLIRSIVFETLETFLGDVRNLDEDADLEAALRDLTLRTFQFGADRPEAVRLIGAIDASPLPDELRAETTRLQRESLGAITMLFERAIANGELPQVDPIFCATSYVGLVMFQLSARERTPAEELIDAETAAGQLTRYAIAGSHGAPNEGPGEG